MPTLSAKAHRRLPLIGYLFLVALIVVVLGLRQQDVYRGCVQNKNNRSAIRGIIMRGLDVGKPGTPGYDYYRTHPEEALVSITRVREALEALPPISCESVKPVFSR